jgi:hypothetical protein
VPSPLYVGIEEYVGGAVGGPVVMGSRTRAGIGEAVVCASTDCGAEKGASV